MPAIRTTPGRTVLAVLAGAVSAPVFVILLTAGWLVMMDGSRPATGGPSDAGEGALIILGLGILIGGPIALASIVILFGPLWYFHRRFDGGAWSFIAMAGFAGLLMVGVMSWISRDNELPGALTVALFTVSAALSGAVMWLVAYAGGQRSDIDVRALPQANFSAAEPKT